MDRTAILPNGRSFEFWEKEQIVVKELHVNTNHPQAADTNSGTIDDPLKTIQAAAELAIPGTRILIHGGEYREWVHPIVGGSDAEHMISFEAFGDGEVILKASEEVTSFAKSTGWDLRRGHEEDVDVDKIHVWVHKLDPDMFRGYNPFCAVNVLHDRLYLEYDKVDMTTFLNRRGVVYCDGKPLHQVAMYSDLSVNDNTYWVEANGMRVHFRLSGDADPADHKIEFSCREQCIAPDEPFISYIKVKGITCLHAAMGAPVPQRGAISCNRGHHWIIEDCVIDWANTLAIDTGNECWNREESEDQIIGYSVIRRCTIRNAGVCGIAGLSVHNMLIEDNLIEGTGWQKMERAFESGGIKVHNCVNSLLRRNVIRNTYGGDHIWMDCGNENNRITSSLFFNGYHQRAAIFLECTKNGVNLIDNNIIWNVEGNHDPSKVPSGAASGWYKLTEDSGINGYGVYGEGTDFMYIANNLIGKCRSAGYYAQTVPFRMWGTERGGTSRDACIFNNIFYDCESAIKLPTKDNKSDGNLFVREKAGYLRIMNPLPEVCLNLPTWQQFYGFDMESREGWFDIDIDTEKCEMRVSLAKKRIGGRSSTVEKRNYIYEPSEIKEMKKSPLVSNDFYGDAVDTETCIPGPFRALKTDITYSIDPRKPEQ